MDTENGLLTLAVAVIGGGCTVLAARWSRVRPAPADPDEEDKADLEVVSPRIWDQLNGRIGTLEAEIVEVRREATAAARAYADELTGRERLLRQAMRIIRRANRRLVARDEAPEEIPRELIPYSID
ncbi:hypothetical protein ABZX72_29685 [Streptomyces cyaneofuscatus]|uniref:hypothetical protein n=1 Tax=Streptomyces cyaneofuscatus TaxID=66883 RepID=UPI0033BDB680